MKKAAIVAGVLALGACQTITEDLPQRPSQVASVLNPSPVIVVTPIQLPSPTAPAPTPTPNSPGAPAPTPAPAPAPTPNPSTGESPSLPPSGSNPVVKVFAKVYFVECGGVPVPNSESASEAEVGCRVHMDATSKDANNAPRDGRDVNWNYSDRSLISVAGQNPYGPVLTALRRGNLTTTCVVDGVRSNEVRITFK